MDEPETSPLPPLPIGDTLGVPSASPDALRQILRRHRRRQTVIGGVGLVAVLVAGSFGGWAVGRHDRGTSGGVRVAAGGQPTAAPQGATAPTASSQGAGGAVGGFAPIGAMYAPPSTQLLVRDASDGTRVRLYQQDIGGPKFSCATGQTCVQPPVPACVPASFVVAEVSDDQVAGQTGSPLWQPASSGALQMVTTQVVGAGQPQPILVVVARTAAPTAKVTLTTAYGSDQEAATATGWVALAVRLPATFTTAGVMGAPVGKVVAADGGGNAVSYGDLASASPVPPACQPPMSCVAAAPPSSSSSSSGSSSSSSGSSSASSAPSTSAAGDTASACGCVPPAVKAPPAAAGGAPTQITCSVSVGPNGTVSSGSASASASTSTSGTASSGTATSGPASTTP